MTQSPKGSPGSLSLVKQSLLALEEMQANVVKLEAERNQPVSIVGIGCRFPRANSPEAYWRLLQEGVDAITEVPPERWDAESFYDADPDAPGKMSSKWGGFLDGIDQFDAAFFGISPREAEALDPQQRLLLEVSWEALERAGLPADRLAGGPVGVFVSLGPSDYAHLAMMSDSWDHVDPYTSTGGAPSTASGRVSYTLGLHGPNFVVESGCSSSLVAVHLACESLRRGECDVAIAGGVNVILSPYSTLVLSKLRALSADGKCRAFDAAADGFARGEGCGIVVLRRQADALAAGDPIVAVVRGSAVNHGGTASGLTAPNPVAQRDVIRAALARAGLSPEQIGFVETHGTGTSLGDSIEVRALKDVFGGPAPRLPLWLGSVKTNLGHLEASAGIAGLIKAALVLQHRTIPPHVHFTRANPHLPITEIPARIATRPEPWADAGAPRRAGVSSFGVGGTNAHVVLEEAPSGRALPASPPDGAAYLVPLSARSPEAVRALAGQLAQRLGGTDAPSLAELADSAGCRRSHLEHRIAVVAHAGTELADALTLIAHGQSPAGAAAGQIAPRWRGLAFVFSGQGSQWLGMGRALLSSSRTFAAALRACDDAVRAVAGWSVVDELCADPASARLEQVDVAQPVLFAVQIALAALWRSWGVEPDVVVGHSMGEVAAAHVAGALSLEDAALVICRRSELFARVSGSGAMLMVELSHAEAHALVAQGEDAVWVAAYNGPRATVLSGARTVLTALAATLLDRGVFHRWIKVSFASHGPEIEPVLPELRRALSGLRPRAAALPMMSTVTGELITGEHLGAGYWVTNARRPVLFAQAIDRLARADYLDFVEISPHPLLLPAVRDGLAELGVDGAVWPTLRRGEPERAGMLDTAAGLYAGGRALDWAAVNQRDPADAALAVDPSDARRRPRYRATDLPTYPWQRRRHFSPAVTATLSRLGRRQLDDAYLEVAWREQPRPAPRGAGRRWLVVIDDAPSSAAAELGAAVVAELARNGRDARLLLTGSRDVAGFAATTEEAWTAELARELTAGAVGIADLSALQLDDAEPLALEPALERWSAIAVAQARAVVQRADADIAVWKITCRAQSPGGEPPRAAQAVAWGLGRSLAAEHPDQWGGLIDLDLGAPAAPGAASAASGDLAAELAAEPRGEQVSYRRGKRLVARLTRLPAPQADAPLTLRRDGCYLVTGGLSGLGRAVARRLAERGAGALALLARTAVPDRARWATLASDDPAHATVRAIEDLEALGCRVDTYAVDVADAAALERVLADLAARPALPLRGVVHCAGALGDAVLTEQRWPSMRAALGPKVLGGLHLDRLTRRCELDFFVLFAAGAGLMGPPGQAAYAAANTYLDALAARRRAEGRPALAIDWGLFADVGMASAEQRGQQLEARGLRSLTAREGLQAFERLLARPDRAQLAVMPVDWQRWAAAYPGAARVPFFAELVGALADEPAAEPTGDLQALPPEQRTQALRAVVRHVVSRALRLTDPDALDGAASLHRLGLDSLMALEVRSRLRRQTGVLVSTARLLSGASADELLAELEDGLRTASLLAQVQEPRTCTPTDDSQLEVLTL